MKKTKKSRSSKVKKSKKQYSLKVFKKVWLVSLVVGIVIIGFLVVTFYQNRTSYAKYNESPRLSFEYPKDWSLKDYTVAEAPTSFDPSDRGDFSIDSPDYKIEPDQSGFYQIITGHNFWLHYSSEYGKDSYDSVYKYIADVDINRETNEPYYVKKTFTSDKGINMVMLTPNYRNKRDRPLKYGYKINLNNANDRLNNVLTEVYFADYMYQYAATYSYPSREDNLMDPAKSAEFMHLLNSIELK